MGFYDRQVLPRLVNVVCGLGNMTPLRERACAGLTGRVIEIGFGSGHNIPLLPEAVTELGAVEPSDTAWHLAHHRVEESRVPVHRVGLDAQRLTADDASYDSAIVTFALCTIPDPHAALDEVHRVLKPGGVLHLVEHGQAPDGRVALWQQRVQPVWGPLAGGCHLGRPIRALLEESGFDTTGVESFYGSRPKAASFFYAGAATKV